MPEAVHVAVLPTYGGAYLAVCSVHGAIAVWSDPRPAAWDAIGHAAAHHTGDPPCSTASTPTTP